MPAFVHLVDIDVRDAEQHVDDLYKILVRGVSEGSLEVDAVVLEHIDIYIHVLYLMLRIQHKATFQKQQISWLAVDAVVLVHIDIHSLLNDAHEVCSTCELFL